jgi:hypothetical protein
VTGFLNQSKRWADIFRDFLFVNFASVHIAPVTLADIQEIQVIPAQATVCTYSALKLSANPLQSHSAPLFQLPATCSAPAFLFLDQLAPWGVPHDQS